MKPEPIALLACTGLLALLSGCAHSSLDAHGPNSQISFVNISKQVGLQSEPSWKYGGPTVADIDNDGDYDFALSNHHEVPTQLFEQADDGGLIEHRFPLQIADMHGIAAGDYDGDGDNDLLAALGGGNGLSPRPPMLLRNDGWKFVDVTDEAGLGGLGARGRSVRWIDIDADGDLDIIAINARQIVGEEGPRNLVYENLGNGRFAHRPRSGIEKTEAERMLVTDFDGDRKPDLVLFSPLSLWRGDGRFGFNNVTGAMLPPAAGPIENITAVVETDIDNDGDFDFYLARGKTYYELANNSLDFDPETTRLDIRDEGNKSRDGISFTADGAVTLSDFWHWKRATEIVLPVYVGAESKPVGEPREALIIKPEQAAGFPEKPDKDGWHLGYLGDGKWRLEWHLSDNLAWGIRGSITGVKKVEPDFQPQEQGVPDILFVREGTRFVDRSHMLPAITQDNSWGVTAGDFDNDGRADLFVYRFGKLRKRLPDILLQNQDSRFIPNLSHGASGTEGHGDMGTAFDWDGDGWIDLLSGDDDQGRWHLYRNNSGIAGNGAVTVRVGYSSQGTDPTGAVIETKVGPRKIVRRIGSNGATHSQGLLNIQHIGVGKAKMVDQVSITWRDGTSQTRKNVKTGSRTSFGNRSPR